MCIFFFFNDTATTEIYTLSLHDALPIYGRDRLHGRLRRRRRGGGRAGRLLHRRERRDRRRGLLRRRLRRPGRRLLRSEEHTSELQSRQYLVCRLLLEKKQRQVSSTNRVL